MTKYVKYGGLCIIYTIVLVVFCWLVVAFLAIKIPIGSYILNISVQGNSLQSVHELMIEPQLKPTIVVYDRVTLRDFPAVMDNIFSKTHLHDKLRDQRIHSVSFREPNSVEIKGEVRFYQNKYLHKKKKFVAKTKFSISEDHVLWIPLTIEIKNFPNWLDPKLSPFVFNIRKESGLPGLVINKLMLENSGTNKYKVNIVLEIGISDIWNKVF